jgi:hypothetical protein
MVQVIDCNEQDVGLPRLGRARRHRQRGGGKGNDQLAELLPGLLFTVIDPTSITINKDGSDGGPAEILVKGSGGDLLQAVALLNLGLLQPARLELSTIYRLRPGAKYVEIETTVKNTSSAAHPLPFLNPQELKDLGFEPDPVTPEQFRSFLRAQSKLFAKIVADANVKIEQ